MTCNIEVTLDENGNFIQADVFREGKKIIIPCTESSAGRAGSKPEAHPLSDKLQYVAGDFYQYGGEVTSGFKKKPEEPFCQLYKLLEEWSEAFPNNYKLLAVKNYLRNKSLIKDLFNKGILFLDNHEKMIKEWGKENKGSKPPIFYSIKNVNDATVGWHVQKSGKPADPLWKDKEIHKAWTTYYENRKLETKLCFISGRTDTASAEQHPKKILHGASNAKIISSNDEGGFTFLGRFITADEACSISAIESQKMHNALKWLIERQGYHNGTQNIVAWAVSGKDIPDPMKGTDQYDEEDYDPYAEIDEDYDAGQAIGKAFRMRLAGYRSKLSSTESIVVLAFDAATSGRAALTYYRELTGSDFLDKLERWYSLYEWIYPNKQNDSSLRVRPPEQLAKDIYGNDADENLIHSVVQRLLPCIVDGSMVPFGLVVVARCRASRPTSFKRKEDWENTLSTACALFRGYHYKKEKYKMSLETNRTSRDYLYGRLLSVAEAIEREALKLAGEEGRSTTAERYMQQFAEQPFKTWRIIELGLYPYKARLQTLRPTWKIRYDKSLDEIQCLFNADDFTNNTPLSGEFLLGYHCQRRQFFEKSSNEVHPEEKE